MLRALLTYPLILAVAAGPLLCCCTAGRVLAAAAPASANPPRPSTKPALRHSCCSHKSQEKSEKPAKPSPSKPGQCPCKEGASKVQATPGTTSAGDELQQARSAFPDFYLLTVGPALLVSPGDRLDSSRSRSASLFPSASDLLFSHHKLRC